jgi:hypothetical protein
MKRVTQSFNTLLGLALLAAIGYGLYWTFGSVAAVFSRLDAQLASVTAIASVVVLFSASMIARSVRTAAQPNSPPLPHEDKTFSYQLFVDYWSNLLRLQPAVDTPLPEEYADKLCLLDRLLALHGANEVIEAHTALRTLERVHGAGHAEVRAGFRAGVAAVRKDLGSDVLLDAEELLLARVPTRSSDATAKPETPRFVGSTLMPRGRAAA